jgi:osmotically-inducible protein OsmY
VPRTLRPTGLAALLLVLPATVPLSGCVVPIVAGGAATAGYAASQERGISGQISDVAISAQIAQKWREYNPEMAHQLTLDVYQGRVLIVGPVSNPEYADEAVKRAWQVEGVKEVNHDIEVSSRQTFGDEVRDSFTTKKLESRLLLDSQVRSLNYSITTVNGTIYLMGSARSQAELDRVVDYARNLSDVRKVMSYVKIRSGAEDAQASAAPAPERPRVSAAPAAMPARPAAPVPPVPITSSAAPSSSAEAIPPDASDPPADASSARDPSGYTRPAPRSSGPREIESGPLP